jgi:hypothetical protein
MSSLGAQDAIDVIQSHPIKPLRNHIDNLVAGTDSSSHIIGFVRGPFGPRTHVLILDKGEIVASDQVQLPRLTWLIGFGKDGVSDLIERAAGAVTFINLKSIVNDVRKKVEELSREAES